MGVATAGILATLLFTVPATNQLRYLAPDPFNADSLTLHVECAGGDSTRDLDSVRVYRWSISGGLAVHAASVYVRGLEGRPDSVQVDAGPGAHFFVVAVDTAGNVSCASDVVYIGPVTGVDAQPDAADPVVRIQFFTVTGQLARHGPQASGVYFVKETHRSGAVSRRRVVLLK